MEETTRKSVITVIEILALLVILYIISVFLTGYLESVEEEIIATVLNAPQLLI